MPDSIPGDDTPDFDWNWSDDDTGWVPPGIDPSKPSTARMYDYALGGKDNFAVDREALDHITTVYPVRPVALANRGFLLRAVKVIAESGVRQFLDLGSGIPTSPSVHEVVRAVQPDATVVYVDNDPIVIAHTRARRSVMPGVITLEGDVRDPEEILNAPALRRAVDFSQPVALLFAAVLHFVRPERAPEIVARFRSELAPGSFVVMSLMSTEGMTEEDLKLGDAAYERASSPLYLRTRAQIERLFEGLEILEPGVVNTPKWRADEEEPFGRVLAGVGRVV